MLQDVPTTSLLEEITPQRKEYLRFMLGREKPLKLTFDPSKIPAPSDFTKRMDAYYERQIAKGAVRVKKVEHEKEHPLPVQVTPQRKDKKYSWIPISEIHTARTKIDSLLYLTPAEKKELHEKFARLVSCLISQFDAIGNVDDDSITPDQSASLTTAFSEALVEIQKELFQPISRQHALAKRGPLFQKKRATAFEDRRIKYRNRHTLSEIAANSRKKTSQLEKNQKQNEDLLVDSNTDNVEYMLPPAYRPPPIGDMPPPDRFSFMEMSKKIKEEMERVDAEHKKRPKTAQGRPRKRHVDILMTPRKTVQTPVAQKKTPRKSPRQSKPVMSFEHVRNPENEFVEMGDYHFEPIAGVETGSCLEGIERLFAPLRAESESSSSRLKEEVEPIAMPPTNHKKPEAKETNYLFKPDLKKISELMDVSHLFGDDTSDTVEHQSLTQLWEQLGLHPDTRLLMAARLCSIVTDDLSSDYHFQAIVGATDDFMKYNKAYKKYRDALNYEPDLENEETAARIAKLATKYKVAEDAFKSANQEMVHVLGNEILTKKGPISMLIASRAEKMRRWREKCGIDKFQSKPPQPAPS